MKKPSQQSRPQKAAPDSASPMPGFRRNPKTVERVRQSKDGRGGYYRQGFLAGIAWVESDDGPEYEDMVRIEGFPEGLLRCRLQNAEEANEMSSWLESLLSPFWSMKAFWQTVTPEFVVYSGASAMPDATFIRGFIRGVQFASREYGKASGGKIPEWSAGPTMEEIRCRRIVITNRAGEELFRIDGQFVSVQAGSSVANDSKPRTCELDAYGLSMKGVK